MLITPEFGPRVRIAKIFTDFPLSPDQPILFGVRSFCEFAAAALPPARRRRFPTGLRLTRN